uniref:Candidate secreted effector n=1 Tax=Meloidogyne incognita TaxID=6306 RepID=A0A914LZF2_MELIC
MLMKGIEEKLPFSVPTSIGVILKLLCWALLILLLLLQFTSRQIQHSANKILKGLVKAFF